MGGLEKILGGTKVSMRSGTLEEGRPLLDKEGEDLLEEVNAVITLYSSYLIDEGMSGWGYHLRYFQHRFYDYMERKENND